jgi:hypothetical protein
MIRPVMMSIPPDVASTRRTIATSVLRSMVLVADSSLCSGHRASSRCGVGHEAQNQPLSTVLCPIIHNLARPTLILVAVTLLAPIQTNISFSTPRFVGSGVGSTCFSTMNTELRTDYFHSRNRWCVRCEYELPNKSRQEHKHDRPVSSICFRACLGLCRSVSGHNSYSYTRVRANTHSVTGRSTQSKCLRRQV